MQLIIKNKNSPSIGLFFVYVTSTISFATTTVESNILFDDIRSLSAILSVLFLLISAGSFKINKSTGYSLLIFFILMLQGTILAEVNGFSAYYIGQVPIYSALTLTLIFFFSQAKREVFGLSLIGTLVAYHTLVLLYTFFTGGLIIDFPPSFNLEHLRQITGKNYSLQYSQGVTKFYGLASVLSIFALLNTRSRLIKIVLFVHFLMFIVLTISGGARGDFLGTILTISLLFYFRYRKYSVVIVVTGAFLTFLALEEFFSSAILGQRLGQVWVDLDTRLLLINQTVEIFSARPDCLLFGCGYNFFQYFYGYDIIRYPHNLPIELMLTYGLPITLLMLVLLIEGFKSHLRAKSLLGDGLAPLFILFFIIGLKSGSILTSWFFIAAFIHFSAVGLLTSLKR